MNFKKLIWVIAFLFLNSSPIFAYWVWSPEHGRFINSEGGEQNAAEEQYEYAMSLYREKNLDQAADQLEDILKKFPNSKIAPEAQYRLGTVYEEKADYLKAFNAYKHVVETYPSSERFNEVIEREFRIGNVFLSGKKGKVLGLEILPAISKAAEIFQHIGKYAPYSEFGDDAQFQLALTYRKMGRFADAVSAFQTLIEQYPQSELVNDARYQLAETTFTRSKTEFRDQRALDEASQEVDRFLALKSESGATEKAEKLRQVIDEKNAEKNYRIGLYYEKQKYLESALIYYTDTATRYPSTHFGAQAKEKIASLKEPADYLKKKEDDLDGEIQVLEAKLKTAESDPAEKKRLSDKLDGFKKRQKNLEKEKKNSLKVRQEDLKRREGELKQKTKNLEAKKKLMAKNPSEDFKRAIERWEASLNDEKANLQKEKEQLSGWRTTLGVPERHLVTDIIPFLPEKASELDIVRQIEAKKLYKLSEKKQELLDEKENLYKQHEEIAVQLAVAEGATSEISKVAPEDREKLLADTQKQIEELETKLEAKRGVYDTSYGASALSRIMRVPTRVVSGSGALMEKSWDALNPFDNRGRPDDLSIEGLQERRMHVKEKIASGQHLTDTLTQAFDAHLALESQKKLLARLEGGEKTDPVKLRKEVKSMEKNIRNRYREIEDLHDSKNQLLDELDAIFKQKEEEAVGVQKAGRIIAAPARSSAWFVKSFLFGLPHREVELTQAVEKKTLDDPAVQAKAGQLKEQIELQSLLIDTKNREIANLTKELEILKAKASLAGGYKFRSVLVDVPYAFIEEAVDSAKRLVPRQNREDMILSRMNQETKKLEELKSELRAIEDQMEKKSGKKIYELVKPESEVTPAPAAAPESPTPTPAVPAVTEAEKTQLEKEMQDLAAELKTKQQLYVREKIIWEGARSDKDFTQDIREIEKLRSEMKETQERLSKVIHQESEMETEEAEILAKRISEIDRSIQQVSSKAVSQDLLTERSRMEERISQIESRRDFLSKELERFQFAEAGTTTSSAS